MLRDCTSCIYCVNGGFYSDTRNKNWTDERASAVWFCERTNVPVYPTKEVICFKYRTRQMCATCVYYVSESKECREKHIDLRLLSPRAVYCKEWVDEYIEECLVSKAW